MNWDGIETERLLLKGLDDSDVEFLYKQFSDEYVCRYLYDAEPFGCIEEARRLVEQFGSERSKTINRWIIVEKASGRTIGTCGFHCLDTANCCVEVGYDLQEEQCGKGMMTEALTAILGVAFHGKGLHRIQAFVSVDNLGSCKLLEKLGFTREGIIRDKHFFRGAYYDHYCYSMLESEWRG